MSSPIIFKEFGSELIIYHTSDVHSTMINGINTPYHTAWVISNKQKNHDKAISWCGNNAPIAIQNTLKNCRILGDDFSYRRNHKVMKLMFEAKNTNFVVDFTVDQLVEIIGHVKIENGVFSEDMVIVYVSAGKKLFIPKSMYTSEVPKQFKLSPKKIVEGMCYVSSSGSRVYIGQHNNKFIFVSDAGSLKYNWKIKRKYKSAVSTNATSFIYNGNAIEKHNTIRISDFMSVTIQKRHGNDTIAFGGYVMEEYDKVPSWTVLDSKQTLNVEQCNYLINGELPVTIKTHDLVATIDVHPLFNGVVI